MPDPDYPSAAQFDLRLQNDSRTELGVAGDYIRCVDIARAEIEPADGDLVLVEITHGPTLREKEIMRVECANGARRLSPIGREGVVVAMSASDLDIRIVAKILYVYQKI